MRRECRDRRDCSVNDGIRGGRVSSEKDEEDWADAKKLFRFQTRRVSRDLSGLGAERPQDVVRKMTSEEQRDALQERISGCASGAPVGSMWPRRLPRFTDALHSPVHKAC